MSIFEKQLIVFDLDGTLAPSKSPMQPDMAALMVKLLALKKVAVISGGNYGQFQTQFLTSMPGAAENYSNLLLLPTSGTRMYVWKGSWTMLYAEDLKDTERARIKSALEGALKAAGYVRPEKIYGDLIEDRESQITFSALGQKAPLEFKKVWDPDRKKRSHIIELLQPKLPEYDVRMGGTTSIDITKRGVNKAYAIRKLEQYLKLEPDQIVFVGDALYPGGNDYPAKATGVDCIQVSGPEETTKLVTGWIEN